MEPDCRMPLNAEHVQASILGGFRLCELRHEILSNNKKKGCVMLTVSELMRNLDLGCTRE